MNIVWQQIHMANHSSSDTSFDDPQRQCLACQQRRKRCDSTPVACLRCMDDHIICPGYADISNQNGEYRRHERQSGRTQLKPSRPRLQLGPSTTQHSKDWTMLLDSIKYYNANVVPYTMPAQLPYRRQSVPNKYWDIMPPILHYLWIMNVRAMQADKSNADPWLNTDLVQYRGRSLNVLQKMMKDVPEAVKDPHGVALYAVLFLMGSYLVHALFQIHAARNAD